MSNLSCGGAQMTTWLIVYASQMARMKQEPKLNRSFRLDELLCLLYSVHVDQLISITFRIDLYLKVKTDPSVSAHSHLCNRLFSSAVTTMRKLHLKHCHFQTKLYQSQPPASQDVQSNLSQQSHHSTNKLNFDSCDFITTQ